MGEVLPQNRTGMDECVEKNSEPQLRCTLCTNCRQLTVNAESNVPSDPERVSKEKCNRWLERCSVSDCESVISCTDDESSVSQNTDDCHSDDYSEKEVTIANQILTPFGALEINDLSRFNDAKNNYRNVTITKSKNIHLGNITYINGPVFVNQSATVINKHTTVNQLIFNKNNTDVSPPRILERKTWLAQPPSGVKEYLKRPAQLVIICHTATEEGYTEPDNILLIRLIQQFHVESRKWDDISYHYMIGADGNIYEGRGWDVKGAHTYGYNENSIAIAFVGCYTDHLPPSISLAKVKQLIEYGVEIGKIDPDYHLLAHCQCTTTESPGRTLYTDIQTWPHWNREVSINSPSPLAQP